MGERAGPTQVEAAVAAPAAAAAISRIRPPDPDLTTMLPPSLAPRGLAPDDAITRSLAPVSSGAPSGFDLARIPARAGVPDEVSGRAPLVDELGAAPIGPQLRPTIGEVDDHLEREADRVAATALRLPGPPSESAPSEAVRAANEPPSPDAAALTESPADEAQLTHGGRPLPPHLRTFFEHRLGVELGHVRIHQGADSDALNRDVAARALTYGNHVWLGRGEPVAPTFTLAHELTHVVQQTQPRAHRPAGLSHASTSVQRALQAPYWAPASGKGWVEPRHDKVVRDLGKVTNDLFTEVPVPEATARAAGLSKKKSVGVVDLYKGNKAGPVGIAFHEVNGKPVPFSITSASNPLKKTFKGKSQFSMSDAAPKWDGAFVTHVAKAPTSIGLGDVKPLPWAASYLGSLFKVAAGDQLARYREGLLSTADRVNDLVTAGKSRGKSTWSLTTAGMRLLGEKEVNIPTDLAIAKPIAAQERLHLWEGSSPLRVQPATPVMGDQRVFTKGSNHDGVWHYVWIPETGSMARAATAQPAVDRLAQRIQVQLVAALAQPPAVTGGPVTPKPRSLDRRLARLRRDAARRVRRRTPPKDDTFDLVKWKNTQADFKKLQPGVEKTQEWKNAKGQQKAHEAHVQLAKLVPSVGAPPGALEQTAKNVGKVEFWLSWKGRVLARLRKAFGKIFIKLAQGFHAIKVRITEFFKKTPDAKPSSDAWFTKVIRVCWKIIKWAVPRLISQVCNTLWDALARGVADKIKEYIPIDEFETDLRATAAELAKKLGLDNIDDLDNEAVVDLVVTKVAEALGFDAEMKLFEDLADIANVLSTIGTLVSWAKWIIRITAAGSQCAWPPLIGCLKILLVPLVEWAALELFDKIAGECWFEEHVASYVRDLNLLKTFGRTIGVALIHKIQAVSPEVGSLFKVSDVAGMQMRSYDCDRSQDKYTPTKGQLELADFATTMGESGLQALMELEDNLTSSKSPPDPESTSKKIRQVVENAPRRGGGMKDGEPLERRRAREEERAGAPPKEREHGKPESGDHGPNAPADPGEPGEIGEGPPGKEPIEGKDNTEKGPPRDTPDAPPRPQPEGTPEPGDAEGTDQQGGKQKDSPKGKEKKKGSRPGGTAKGSTEDMRGRARTMLGRLKRLRDQLQKQQRASTKAAGGGAGGKPQGGAQQRPKPGGTGGTGTRPKPDAGEETTEPGTKGKDDQGSTGGAGERPSKPDPKAEAAADAKAKAARTQALIDLIDVLIELLKRIADGKLDDADGVEAEIAILVDNASKGVTLDPNADRIIYVFKILGGTVGREVTGRAQSAEDPDQNQEQNDKDQKDKDQKDKDKDPADGDTSTDATDKPQGGLDDLRGDPLDQGDGAPQPDQPEPDQPRQPEPPEQPRQPEPPAPPGNKQPKGRPKDEGVTPEPGGDKPGKPGDTLVVEFYFDPIRDNGVITGYHVTPANRTDLRLDSDRIVNNRTQTYVARVTIGGGPGDVTLKSGVLIPHLTGLARDLVSPDNWTGSGSPVLKLNFFQAPLATADEP